MIFEWNIAKSEKNLKNHGISSAEAELASKDFYAVEELDDEYSSASEHLLKMTAIVRENFDELLQRNGKLNERDSKARKM